MNLISLLDPKDSSWENSPTVIDFVSRKTYLYCKVENDSNNFRGLVSPPQTEEQFFSNLR